MALIVQKFGGSSVADADRIRHVAELITNTYKRGNDVVVVLSAQGDTTDDLLEKAYEINPSASAREMDMLLATGEQQSIALMAMAIDALGYPAVSLTGWQVGLETNSNYGVARIKRVSGTRIREELDRRRIVLVAGFQGINKFGDQTTLGRGGSDTTAVALAVALKADLCQIYTDVDGVYTADPRKVPNARKMDEITFDEMLELASLGAQVLHNRSVEMAKRYNMNLEVLSSFTGEPGTIVKEAVKQVEKTYKVLLENKYQLGCDHIDISQDVSKVSVVGGGMVDNPGVAATMFEALYEAHINIRMISTSEIKVSVLINKDDTEKAVAAIHDKFFA